MKFEDATTTTIGELRVGDFIVVVPTQERMRGVKFDSGVKKVEPTSFKRGRGAAAEIVPGSILTTHRTPQRYNFPNHFTCTVRRYIEEGS